MKKLQNFQEATFQTTKPTIDREAGVIKGVKILGTSSKNGREYTPQALREAAAIYEGLGVNTNHPSRETPNISRTVEEGVGWLENVTVKPEGVFGDLCIIRKHPLAEAIFEAAERKPDRFGLSHNASGECVTRQGKQIVESIKSVRSVDLVQNPATNQSLFESEDPVTMKTITFKKLIESLPAKSKERKALTALMESDELPMVTPDMPVEMPTDTGATDTDSQVRAAIKTAISSLLDDDTLSIEDLLTRIEALLNSQATALGIDIESAEGEPPPEGDGTVTESVNDQDKRIRLLEQTLADRDATEAARTLLESSKIKVTPARIANLKRTTDKNERKELLEDWLKADGPAPKPAVQRPTTSRPAPLLEGVDGDDEYPEDHKSFLRSIGARVPVS